MTAIGGYRELPPPAALQPFVECFWCLATTGEQPAVAQRILPDGCVDFLIDRRGGEAHLVGAMTRAQTFVPGGAVAIAAVRFRPGGAAAFVGDELDACVDAQLPLREFGGAARELAERALDAATPTAAIAALQTALLRWPRAAADDAAARALRQLLAAPVGARVDAIASAHGISRQQFTRQVRRRTGLSPKALAGILRFRAALPALRGGAPLAQVALDHGYADQAHLARAVRELAGVTPSALRAGR